MSVELAILLTESILILVTAGLILYSITEGRQRINMTASMWNEDYPSDEGS